MKGFLKKVTTILAPVLGAGAIGVCPLCWVGSASLLVYLGLGALIPYWRWLGFGLVALGAVGFLLDYRAHRNPRPLILLIIGGILLYVGRYVYGGVDFGGWPIWGVGGVLIIVAVIYNRWLFRKPLSDSSASISPKHITTALIVALALIGLAFSATNRGGEEATVIRGDTTEGRFAYLAEHGNSSCSAVFTRSIPARSDGDHIRGSCCSPMSLHRYSEQVAGLKKFAAIPEIPPDPYDIEAGVAKRLMAHYDAELTPGEQKAYDFAMANSHEKGPCCCKCWRWYVYGGLGKLLIQEYGFTGEQITEVWNLSDGCGGDEEHQHA